MALAALLLAGLGPASAAPSLTAADPIPAPAVPADLPADVDPLAAYQGQSVCDDSAKAGTDKLVELIKSTYPDFSGDVWPPRDCAEGGRSEHKEYRAIDWMIDSSKPQQRAVAQAFLKWLLATDANGNVFAMARRLGVMYIGWNNRIWESYTTPPGWSDIDNGGQPCSQTPQNYYDTAPCHRDHIHMSLSWDGAAGTTSFWGGTPTPEASCPRWSSTDARPLVTTRGLDFETVKATRVFDSSDGIEGSLDPCRLTQLPTPTLTVMDDGSKRGHIAGETGPAVYVPVLGFGRVPADQVRAVAVRIGVRDANAPTSVYAWASGADAPSDPLLSTRIGVDAAVETVVPIGDDGTIAVAVDAGSADVTVDVLGYFVRRSTAPIGTTGSLTPLPPTLAYTTRGSQRGPLKPGETRLVSLAGRAGIPALDSGTPVASVWLTLTTSGSRTSGSVIVARPHTIPAEAAARVPVRRLTSVTGAAMTGVDEKGRITLTNTSHSAINVDVTATGWSQRGSSSGDLLLPIDPVVTLDTASGTGVRAGSGGSTGMRVIGVGRIPDTGVAGVIARVSITGGALPAAVSLWPGSSIATGSTEPVVQQTLSAGAGETRTGLVLLPLSPAGGLRWAVSQTDARVVIRIVGVLRDVPVAAVTTTPRSTGSDALDRVIDPFAGVAGVTVPLP